MVNDHVAEIVHREAVERSPAVSGGVAERLPETIPNAVAGLHLGCGKRFCVS